MLVVASRKLDKKQRIYHRCGCLYARRIKAQNRIEMSDELAKKREYHECKYCSGLRGDVRIHKNAFVSWSRKKECKLCL